MGDELWLFLKFYTAHSSCDGISDCNSTVKYTGSNDWFYTYDFLSNVRLDHDKDCVKFKSGNNIEDDDCHEDRFMVCRVTCLPSKSNLTKLKINPRPRAV